jgi:Xaa-Pro aminopeptidase
MTDVLMYADTLRSPDLRHIISIPIGDAFPFVERDGKPTAFVHAVEEPRVRALGGIDVVTYGELGLAELTEQGFSYHAARIELLVRACRHAGITEATVPEDFPLGAAERLRREGIAVIPDTALFAQRRRAKSPGEIEGVRRAQAATIRAMTAIRDGARAGGDVSSESLRAAARRATADDSVIPEYMIVAHGAQAASVHDEGTGPIAPGECIVVDLGLRDVESGCWSDMTRTFCIGTPPQELVDYHAACMEVHEKVVPLIRAGFSAAELHRLSDEIIAAHGYPTILTAGAGISEGYFHTLGHGVGLEIHEGPSLAPNGESLVAGDIITIEPGIYRAGFGGCRIEDLILVTEDGYENLTDFPYEL